MRTVRLTGRSEKKTIVGGEMKNGDNRNSSLEPMPWE